MLHIREWKNNLRRVCGDDEKYEYVIISKYLTERVMNDAKNRHYNFRTAGNVNRTKNIFIFIFDFFVGKSRTKTNKRNTAFAFNIDNISFTTNKLL